MANLFDAGRVADPQGISRLKHRPTVWLNFVGIAAFRLFADELAKIGVRPNWVLAMAIVEENEGVTQSGLGRRLGITRASAMALASTLEQNGLIGRQAMAGRKMTALRLTDLGSEKLDESLAIDDRVHEVIFADLTPEAELRFVRTLRAISSSSLLPTSEPEPMFDEESAGSAL